MTRDKGNLKGEKPLFINRVTEILSIVRLKTQNLLNYYESEISIKFTVLDHQDIITSCK